VDQLLADEPVTDTETPGDILWALTDHLGSVRDVVDSAGRLRIHKNYDAFGNVLAETHLNASGATVTAGQTGYVDEAFGFTGRFYDKATGLQNNLNRWYDASTGRWLSEDPIGFAGGDANLYRYVGNAPGMYTDPSGLAGKPTIPQADRNAIQRFVDGGVPLPDGFLDRVENQAYLKWFQSQVRENLNKSIEGLKACAEEKMQGTYFRNIARQTNRLERLKTIAPKFGGFVDGPAPIGDLFFFAWAMAENKYDGYETAISPRTDAAIEYMLDAISFGTFTGICGEAAKRHGQPKKPQLQLQAVGSAEPNWDVEDDGSVTIPIRVPRR
jgi:RHS repeat-associated protein